jgi:hypothetical protein
MFQKRGSALVTVAELIAKLLELNLDARIFRYDSTNDSIENVDRVLVLNLSDELETAKADKVALYFRG